jgi:hypothetical protein
MTAIDRQARRLRARAAPFCAAVALLSPAPSSAGQPGAYAPDRPWLLALQLENDLFAGFDEQYTNGSYLTVSLPINDLPLWARWTRDGLSGIIDAPRWQAAYGLGQSMFTPSDITDPDPPLDDRPYAGFLFGSLYLSADTGRRLDTVAFEIGVTGPPSLAEAAQKFIHNDLGIGDPPNGWDTQLKTEVAFRALYEQKRRYGAELGPAWGGLEVDAIPHVAVALGTVDTSLAAALTLRIGEGLDMDYGPPRVRRSVAPMLTPADGPATRWNLFAGVGGRLVGRDLFLDGNTFRDSRSVESEPFVADFSLGASVDLGRAVLSYTHVLRSPDFEERDDWAQFGSMSLRIPF